MVTVMAQTGQGTQTGPRVHGCVGVSAREHAFAPGRSNSCSDQAGGSHGLGEEIAIDGPGVPCELADMTNTTTPTRPAYVDVAHRAIGSDMERRERLGVDHAVWNAAHMIGPDRSAVCYLPEGGGSDLVVCDPSTGVDVATIDGDGIPYHDAWSIAMGIMSTYVGNPTHGEQSDIGCEWYIVPMADGRGFDGGLTGGPVSAPVSHRFHTRSFADAWTIVTAHVVASVHAETSW